MIAPQCGVVTAAHAAAPPPAQAFHFNLGDVPTCALAVLALATVIAAIAAYRKQDAANANLAKQVKIQSDALEDQRAANAKQADAYGKLAEQVDLQRQALEDQRIANSKQAEVLAAELRELNLRAEALARQQADAVSITSSHWRGKIPGVRTEDGDPVHMALVTNGSHRPIRDVVCLVQTMLGDVMHPAAMVVRRVDAGVSPMTGEQDWAYVDAAPVHEVGLIKAGYTWGFVSIYETARHQGIFTARFTDNAGLHWQIDLDESLKQIENRDDW